MKVNRLVIHEIKKEEKQTDDAVLFISEELIEIGDSEVEFISKLNKRYRDLRHSNGKFEENTEGIFQTNFINYIKQNEENFFLKFSISSVKDLRTKIKEISPAKGGFIIFADYEDNGHFFGVFFLRNKEGNRLIKKDGDKCYTIDHTVHIDIENLHMASRINISRYINDNKSSYITFINKRNEDAKFFIRWIGASEIINDKEDTKNLLQILKSIAPPKDEDGNEISSPEFIKRVHKIIKDAPRGNVIDIKHIGLTFYDDPNKLTDYAQDNDISINHLFKPDSQELRKFVDIKVKHNKIDLSFPQEYVETGVIVIENNQIIINSPELVNKVQSEIIL